MPNEVGLGDWTSKYNNTYINACNHHICLLNNEKSYEISINIHISIHSGVIQNVGVSMRKLIRYHFALKICTADKKDKYETSHIIFSVSSARFYYLKNVLSYVSTELLLIRVSAILFAF